jgi:hypothetical protein
MSDKPEAEEIPVTDDMIDAGLAAIEPFAFTSMEGYDMGKVLPAAFRAMLIRSGKPQEPG